MDIWVNKGNEFAFVKVLLDTSERMGWELVRYAPWLDNKGQGRFFFIKHNERLHAIHFDCYVPVYCKGINYADAEIIEHNRINYEKGFYVPAEGIEASILFFKDLFYEGKIKEKNRTRISECIDADSDMFLKATASIIGDENANTVLKDIRSGDWETAEMRRSELRWHSIRRQILKRPLKQAHQLWRYLYTRLKEHISEDLGLFIVLMGPDGSGKTTIANKTLEAEGIRKLFQIKQYFHGRFAILPELKQFAAALTGQKEDTWNLAPCLPEFCREEIGMLRASAYALYYGFDAILGHAQIRRVKAYYGLTIADRYYYDYLIQKRYSRCPRWLIKAVACLIPKPDIVVYLKDEPEAIHKRKQDLPLDEIKRQTDVCVKAIKELSNGVTIDASSGVEGVTRELERLVIEKVRAKWRSSPGFRHITKIMRSTTK